MIVPLFHILFTFIFFLLLFCRSCLHSTHISCLHHLNFCLFFHDTSLFPFNFPYPFLLFISLLYFKLFSFEYCHRSSLSLTLLTPSFISHSLLPNKNFYSVNSCPHLSYFSSNQSAKYFTIFFE